MEAAANIDACCAGMNNREPHSTAPFGIDISHESGAVGLWRGTKQVPRKKLTIS
jgi:hypothetical protein